MDGSPSSILSPTEITLHCDDLLELIASNNNNDDEDDPFGHPPPPKIASILKLSSTTTTTQQQSPSTTETTHYYLVICHSSQCVGVQVFCRSGQRNFDASRPQIVYSGSTTTVGVVVRATDEVQSKVVRNPKTKKVRKTMEWTQTRVQIIVAGKNGLAAVEMTLGWNGFGVHHVCPIAIPPHLQQSTVLEIVTLDQTVAISYADGTILYLPSWSLTYPEEEEETEGEEPSVLWGSNIRKVQVQLPDNGEDYHILPLLTKNPSCTHFSDTIRLALEGGPLATTTTQKNTTEDEDTPCNIAALVYTHEKPEALGSSPSLAVYTSSSSPQKINKEDDTTVDDSRDDRDSELLSVAMGATSSLFRGVSNVLGFSSSSSTKKSSRRSSSDAIKPQNNNKDSDAAPPRQLLGPLYQPPTALLTSSGMEYHDAPRRFVTVSVAQDQILTTDSLGRILVLDAPTFSTVQLYKGWREAQVLSFKNKNLALYSPIRKCLQLLQLDQQQKTTIAIPHHPQVQLVASSDERCFVLQPTTHKGFVLKEVVISDSNTPTAQQLPTPASLPSPPTSSSTNDNTPKPHHHIQLQMLQQILSSQKDDNTNPHDKVLEIVSEITNPHEFITVIPLVATNTQDVTLLEQVLKQAQTLAKQDESLQSCLAYHQQLVQTFQYIHDFQVHQSDKHKLFEEEEADVRQQPKSAWAMEGLAWMATEAKVNVSTPSAPSTPSNNSELLSFSQFCQACVLHKPPSRNNSNCIIVLKDSYRTRRPILQHLFQPLLHDTFSYMTLTNVLESMGLQEQQDAILESYFTEWYLHCHQGKLSALAKASLLQLNSNILRWCKSRVAASVDARLEKEHVGADTILLNTIYHKIHETEQLVPAFLLATTVRDAISSVCQKREVRTYGKVYNQNVLQPWESLLKQLRLLIFVKLRMDESSMLEAPLSLQNISELNWNRLVAQDELRASANVEELAALEQQSRENHNTSGNDFWRHMQQACTISEDERAEYLVELEPTQTLIWYVPLYYQHSAILNAHRTILLFGKFQRARKRLDVLQQALAHCRALSKEYALAVRYEMWQSILRPLFQEYLFSGEMEVVEADWIQTVGKAALIVLNLMEQSMNQKRKDSKKDEKDKEQEEEEDTNDDDDSNNWPPFQPDRTLKLLSQKLKQVQLHGDAFDFHRILILGCMQCPSDQFQTLAQAVGTDVFSQAFQPNALCGMLSIPITPAKSQVEAQMEFIQTAITARAQATTRVLDRVGDVLEDLETLALLWSVDIRDVRTLFVLALYELGQDELISDAILLNKTSGSLDVERLVDDGIVLICQRLTQTVLDFRSNGGKNRSVLSRLDADLVEWIRAQASERKPLDAIPPLSFTHAWLLQLLRMSTCSETKQSLHSLSVLTGVILNEIGE